jgi:hypothetical protein
MRRLLAVLALSCGCATARRVQLDHPAQLVAVNPTGAPNRDNDFMQGARCTAIPGSELRRVQNIGKDLVLVRYTRPDSAGGMECPSGTLLLWTRTQWADYIDREVAR